MANTEYDGVSMFLHRIALKYKVIAETSFDIDSSSVKDKQGAFSDNHVFVSGLARSGTTVLMRYLYETGIFRSLTYLDMPFVLMPNIWKKFAPKGKSEEAKERAHKDGILVSFDSPEAFEEVFWRIFCEKDYIFSDHLRLQNITDEMLAKYKKYIHNILVSSDSPDKKRYLSKNNNNVLRVRHLNRAFPNAQIVIPFRDPLQHALSLLAQHNHFCEVQAGDKFTLDYMSWLGHHEFGLNQKTFILGDKDILNKMAAYKKTDINFWLLNWKNYYQYVNNQQPANSFFVQHEALCAAPVDVLTKVFTALDVPVPSITEKPFIPPAKKVEGLDQNLLNECNLVYKELEAKYHNWFNL